MLFTGGNDRPLAFHAHPSAAHVDFLDAPGVARASARRSRRVAACCRSGSRSAAALTWSPACLCVGWNRGRGRADGLPGGRRCGSRRLGGCCGRWAPPPAPTPAPAPLVVSFRRHRLLGRFACELYPVMLSSGGNGGRIRRPRQLPEPREHRWGRGRPHDLERAGAGIAQAIPGLSRHGDADARHDRRRVLADRCAPLALQDDDRVIVAEKPVRGQRGARRQHQEPHREGLAGEA